MELTIYAPGLLLPASVLADTVFDLSTEALPLLLGRGQRHHEDRDWLARAFSTPKPLPAAALRIVGAGETASGQWLCLDPVHWQVSREGVTLASASLDADEAAALIEAIQPVFADWGTLSATQPTHWHLQLSRSLLLETRCLPDSIGQPVDPALPGGLDGPAWRRLIAEAQTILHAHPVNQRREATQRLAINSLWPWGMGALPTPSTLHCDYQVIWSNDALFAGLAAQCNIACIPPPDRYQPATGSVLCHFDQLADPARNLNAMTWRLALLELDEHWILPAIAALKRGECRALRVVGTHLHGDAHATVFSLVRGNLWRFWRRTGQLTELA
ncbi:MAG: hypothetical protein Q8M20_02745 [Rhodocyclaceae bacterium]|nr:hypothetical protein [Rhodocyclaceae bacterium]MDZ4213299.1 hypothetical protein [Rhodocyclaceae bacterium]